MVERPTEKPVAILTQIVVPDTVRDFSPIAFSAVSLSVLRCLEQPPCVQSHASTAVRTLKVQATTPLFGHTKYDTLTAAVPDPYFPQGTKK